MIQESNILYRSVPPIAPPLPMINNLENTLSTSSIEIKRPAFLINSNMLKNALGSLKKSI
jgi:hypothetical protein